MKGGGENEIQSDTGNAFMEKEQSSSKGNSIYRFDLMKTEKLRKDFLPVANIHICWPCYVTKAPPNPLSVFSLESFR